MRGHKAISQFTGGNRLVFLTHRNPFRRPSDHSSPPRVCAALYCWRPLATGLQLRTFAKHSVGLPAHAPCFFGDLWKLRTSHHKGVCGDSGMVDPSCTYPVAQPSTELHIADASGGRDCRCRHRSRVLHLRFRQLSP